MESITNTQPMTDERKSLAAAIRAAQGFALRALGEDLKPIHYFHQIAPGQAHILWLLGHLAYSLDRGVNQTLGGRSALDPAYEPLFDMGARPTPNPSDYPPPPQVLEGFNKAHDLMEEVLTQYPPEALVEPYPGRAFLREMFGSTREVLRMLPYHESYHTGQIAMLRRAQGLPSALGM